VIVCVLWLLQGKECSYGKLFKEGDTVGVELDMDNGTLSFLLYVCQGVARETKHRDLVCCTAIVACVLVLICLFVCPCADVCSPSALPSCCIRACVLGMCHQQRATLGTGRVRRTEGQDPLPNLLIVQQG